MCQPRTYTHIRAIFQHFLQLLLTSRPPTGRAHTRPPECETDRESVCVCKSTFLFPLTCLIEFVRATSPTFHRWQPLFARSQLDPTFAGYSTG